MEMYWAYLSFLFAPSSTVWNNNAEASGNVIKVHRSYFDAETYYTNGLMIYEYGVPDIKERFAKAPPPCQMITKKQLVILDFSVSVKILMA